MEAFAADAPKLAHSFAEAWAKLQELGCGRLRPHPASLEYAAPGCQLPTVWLELTLLTKREHNHDSTVYAFQLPDKAASPNPNPLLLVKLTLTRTPSPNPNPNPTPDKAAPLGLPACASVHLRVPGQGRGGGGPEDFDGSDAARPYAPISSDEMPGTKNATNVLEPMGPRG